MELLFNVKNQIIKREDKNLVVAKSKNYLTARFIFSDDWAIATTKTAVFFNEKLNLSVSETITDNVCAVPETVIYNPYFTVSVFGGDLITVNTAKIITLESGYPDPAPIPIVTDAYVKTTNAETGTNKITYIREKDGDLQFLKDGETTYSTAANKVSSVNDEIGDVVLTGANVDSEHTAINYEVEGTKIDQHLAGIDTAIGNVLLPATPADPTNKFLNGNKTWAIIDVSLKTETVALSDITLTAVGWYTDEATGKQAHKITNAAFTSPTTQKLDIGAFDNTAEEAMKTAGIKSYSTQIDDNGTATLIIYSDSSIPTDITLTAELTKGVQA